MRMIYRMSLSIILLLAIQTLTAQTMPAEEWRLVWSDEFDHNGRPDPAT